MEYVATGRELIVRKLKDNPLDGYTCLVDAFAYFEMYGLTFFVNRDIVSPNRFTVTEKSLGRTVRENSYEDPETAIDEAIHFMERKGGHVFVTTVQGHKKVSKFKFRQVKMPFEDSLSVQDIINYIL